MKPLALLFASIAIVPLALLLVFGGITWPLDRPELLLCLWAIAWLLFMLTAASAAFRSDQFSDFHRHYAKGWAGAWMLSVILLSLLMAATD